MPECFGCALSRTKKNYILNATSTSLSQNIEHIITLTKRHTGVVALDKRWNFKTFDPAKVTFNEENNIISRIYFCLIV